MHKCLSHLEDLTHFSCILTLKVERKHFNPSTKDIVKKGGESPNQDSRLPAAGLRFSSLDENESSVKNIDST